MTNDPFFRDRETRQQVAERLMQGLRLNVEASDPPEVAARKERERKARIEAHDRLFAPGYIEINGRLYSAELAAQLGYVVRYGPAPERDEEGFLRWDAGDDARGYGGDD